MVLKLKSVPPQWLAWSRMTWSGLISAPSNLEELYCAGVYLVYAIVRLQLLSCCSQATMELHH